MVRFAIDEAGVDLNGLAANDARAVFRSFLNFISDVDDSGQRICYDEELFCRDLRNGLSFWNLFDQDVELGLTHDDLELAASVFGRMSQWGEDDSAQPTEFEVSVDNGPTEVSAALAWVHAQAERRLLTCACLCASHKRGSGKHDVLVAGRLRTVWFLSDLNGVRLFFRDILTRWAEVPDDFERYKAGAFPDLLFVDGCFDGIRKMSKPCRSLAPDIVTHLSALSDSGRLIFSRSWQRVGAEFGALGVDISDENGATKSDKKAAAERMRIFNGEELAFWWHSKIAPDRDRIHICPDRVPGGGEIIVGIFCRHLI